MLRAKISGGVLACLAIVAHGACWAAEPVGGKTGSESVTVNSTAGAGLRTTAVADSGLPKANAKSREVNVVRNVAESKDDAASVTSRVHCAYYGCRKAAVVLGIYY